MELELCHAGTSALIRCDGRTIVIVTPGCAASAPLPAPVTIVDRTPLSARLRGGDGSIKGARLSHDGLELIGNTFTEASLGD